MLLGSEFAKMGVWCQLTFASKLKLAEWALAHHCHAFSRNDFGKNGGLKPTLRALLKLDFSRPAKAGCG